MIQRLWEPLSCDEASVSRLAAALGIAPLTARLLCIRGQGDPESARRFLSPSLADLHDPFALADMEVAVRRILAAIARRERIGLHCSYDVDWGTSTEIRRHALELAGANDRH